MKHIPLILFSLLLVNCTGEKPKEEPKKPDTNRPRLVGRIASIPAGRKFVLIQSYGKWTVASGSILTSEGPEARAANLLVTGEKLGQYAAADIRSGTLEVGDAVYTIAKPKGTTTPTTDFDKPAPVTEPEPAPTPDAPTPGGPAIELTPTQ